MYDYNELYSLQQNPFGDAMHNIGGQKQPALFREKFYSYRAVTLYRTGRRILMPMKVFPFAAPR